MRLCETPRRLLRKRCRNSSLEKFEDAFDTALDLVQTAPSDAAFSAVLNFDKCRLEAAGDAISGMALDYFGTDDPPGFRDSRLNNGRIIRLFVRPEPFCVLFLQYLIAFCIKPEAASDVTSDTFMRQIVLDKCVKFHDPCLNCSREIPPEAV